MGDSNDTKRRALARCRVTMLASTAASVAANELKKGDVLATARVAGIQAARQMTSLLSTLHPVVVDMVFVDFFVAHTHVDVEVSAGAAVRSGVEIGALTAVTAAALTIYDMCKSIDRTMTIGEVALWEVSGGDMATWHRPETPIGAIGGVDGE
jgi:cyclic pyranopterin phosphate synthase